MIGLNFFFLRKKKFAIGNFYCWANFSGLVYFVLNFRSINFLQPSRGVYARVTTVFINY